MKMPRQDDTLKDRIDWDAIMAMPRYAGGHDCQMQGLFKGAKLLGHYNEGDYQGSVATAVKVRGKGVVCYHDYYGSCSGCDSWEDANDDSVRTMCINLANGAYVFDSVRDLMAWLEWVPNDPDTTNYEWKRAAPCLAEAIRKSQDKDAMLAERGKK